MTTHAEILKELQTFRGGEFVPKDGVGVRLESRQIRGGFYWGRGEDYCQAVDAHAHIELAAVLAIYSGVHVLVPPQHLSSNPRTSSWAIYRVSVNDLKFVTNLCRDIKDDRATALLAAMKHINGGGA